MAEYRFENIQLVLGEPNPYLRQSIKAALFAEGFRGVVDCHDLQRVVECLEANIVDVLLCDVEMQGGDFCSVIHRMRHHTLGNNPFVITIGTTGDPTSGMVHRVIDSGIDDLLVKPLSVETVLERIGSLARTRKPFVVTHDYIGPDRRKAPRPGEKTTEQIDVPNPLRSKSMAGGDVTNLQRIIDSAASRLNDQKMERYSVQIGYLVEHILTFYDSPDRDRALHEKYLSTLLYVGDDLGRRLRGTSFAHVAELALSLVSLVDRFRDPEFLPDHVDVELLTKLGQAIRRAFSPEQNTAEVAQEISETITKFAKGE